MARVPTPKPRQQFTAIPANFPVSEGGIFSALAQGAAQLAAIAEPIALQEATAAGSEAVRRDENGKLVADTRIPFTKIDQQYNLAAEAIYMTELEGDYALEMDRLRAEHAGDPAAFEQNAREYGRGLVQSAPGAFKGSVGQLAAKYNSRFLRGVTQEHRQQTQQRAHNSVEASIKRVELQMQQLASDPTPENMAELQALNAEWSNLQNIRKGLPGSTLTDEDIALLAELRDEQILGISDKVIAGQVDEAVDVLRRGLTPEGFEGLRDITSGTENGERLRIADSTRKLFPSFHKISPDAQRDILDSYGDREVNSDEAKVFERLNEIHEDTKKAIAKDAIQAATDDGLPVRSLDISDPQSISNRIAQVQALSEGGRNPNGRLLSDNEKAGIVDQIENADATEATAILLSLGGFGEFGHNAVEELGLNKGLENAAHLLVAGGNPEIAIGIVGGSKISDKQRVKSDIRSEGIDTVLGDLELLTNSRQLRDAVIGSAELIYAYKMDTIGGEPEDIWRESLQESLGGKNGRGGIQEVNGHRVLLPSRFTSNEVADAFKTITLVHNVIDVQGIAETGSIEGFNEDQRRERASNFWGGISADGGFPTFVKDQVPTHEHMSDVQLFAVSDGVYELLYGDRALIDSNTGDRFRFSLDQLIARSR